jgi:hypothetical protein
VVLTADLTGVTVGIGPKAGFIEAGKNPAMNANNKLIIVFTVIDILKNYYMIDCALS